MKKHKLLNLFNEFDFKMFIKNNMTSYKIRKAICEEVSESECPSTTAITNYIKKEFNLQWDTKTHSWNNCKSNINNTSKSKKKVSPKDTNTLTINHENKLSDESCINNFPKLKSNQLSIDLTNTKSNGNISNLKTVNNDTLKYDDSSTNKILNRGSLDETISPSQYAEYISTSPNEKFSICINSFVMKLLEERVCNKYNLPLKRNRSKIIQTAIIEYLRITK